MKPDYQRGGIELGDVSDAPDTDLAAGIAGEHLVCADLLLSGYRAFLADQNCPYDVAVDVGGNLVRVQVKTTRKQRPIPQRARHTPAYLFQVRRCGKGGRRQYDERDFDIMALVALDIRKVAYIKLSETKQTLHINRQRFAILGDIRRVLDAALDNRPALFDAIPEPEPQQQSLLDTIANVTAQNDGCGR